METNNNHTLLVFAVLVALGLAAPLAVYPVFLMKVLCFALFACAFNLLIGYVGLLSFGHAMFFGFAAYISNDLKDTNDKNVIASPVFALVRSSAPLFDGTHSTVSLLTDAQVVVQDSLDRRNIIGRGSGSIEQENGSPAAGRGGRIVRALCRHAAFISVNPGDGTGT